MVMDSTIHHTIQWMKVKWNCSLLDNKEQMSLLMNILKDS